MSIRRCLKQMVCVLAFLSAPVFADYQLTEVASGLDHPWSVAFLPNGDHLVTERPGQLLRVAKDGTVTTITGVPTTYFAGQGGFFDVLTQTTNTGTRVYLSYAKGKPEANGTAVYAADLVGTELKNGRDIFWAKTLKDTPQHYGGRMVFGQNETLFITTGDGFDYRESAQDKRSELGKVVRINLDGSLPDDNPFRGELSERIWTYGHRNPQGLAIDSADGALYLHEHGPKGGDEINRIERGNNYGWPLATYGVNYSGARVSPYTEYSGTQQPIHHWTPSIGPSGFAIYRGDMFPEWQGNLFVGALVNREVRRLTLKNGRIDSEQAAFPEIRDRIRDIRVSPEGALYVVTDGENGRIIKVTKN
ncbi:PQQ-dependent oxidoreductase, gdhB family [Aequoribacter fuscus]|jgi:glucose/arabinose dehydrogenase|uniref:PQQ-dependent oxidoreductase, gdhB family n=1 Tax=Aequoribacter fuscus TaxID=2518989 RepID=F3L501_9GAMM|nr:PQQ-dependent sugar dehydrogenase [Aequoribacter fuscus]EGG28588.1 PQQ-dependent oxidoreductase, gdhB family [Aequoribacter fuscus]QHJ87066.1 PQQ-dependent sugar dehydrogenase [Aequoribacter fuscus]